jgi:hypothetical protein
MTETTIPTPTPEETPPAPRRWQHWPAIAVLAVGVLGAAIIGVAVHDSGGGSSSGDVVTLLQNEAGMTHDEAIDTVDVLDNYVDIDELMTDPDAAVAGLTPADGLAFYAELSERNPSAADKVLEGWPDDSSGSPSEDSYDAPTSAEIDDASDNELWDLWYDAPSGSATEAEIEAELERRGEF